MAKIIVALDGMSDEDALSLAEKLKGTGAILKANDLLDGPQGLGIIDTLSQYAGVMDDAKLYDIPNTEENRVKKHAAHNPLFITVHASGEIAMMRKAVQNSGNSKILAVSVLTTMNEEECHLTFGAPVKAKVLQFARNAVLAGVYGLVCSAKELAFLSGYPEVACLKKFTPGIRPIWHLDPKDDQSRVTTPADAVRMGADYIILGRPIVKAKDPVEAVRLTQQEIDQALAAMK